MALSYGFYNSYDGDRKYNAEQISSIFDGVIRDGVFDSIGEILATVAGDGMQVIVKTGKAWFDHTWLVNSSPYPINLPLSDVTRNRIDAIVIETDHSNTIDGRRTSIKVISGTPAYTPQRPEMVTGDFINQHPIAYVYVRAGVSEITASDIEVNVGKSTCPFVTGILKSVSIDDLFNQWAANFQTFMNNKQAEWTTYLANQTAILNKWIEDTEKGFNDWWDEVKSTLDTDTAAKLTLKTQENAAAIANEISRAKNAEQTLQNGINTKQNTITATGILKRNSDGSIVSAVSGTDYADAHVGEWRIKLFDDSGTFYAPASLVNPVHVMCFGGGGAGSYYRRTSNSFSYWAEGNAGCGGSGRFTEKDLILVPNQSYSVTIGGGGTNPCKRPSSDYFKPGAYIDDADWWCNGTKGGATIFGNNLVYADGGEPAYNQHGGNGGAGGAGADMRYDGSNEILNFDYSGGNGGRGYEFGGGAGGSCFIGSARDSNGEYIYVKGGNGGAGGTYGGGGGAGCGNKLSGSGSGLHREIDVGVRGEKGTYGGYGGGKSSSSASYISASTSGSVSEPLSKWYMMLAKQYIQLTDTAKAGAMASSLTSSPYYYGPSGGGGGGFHSDGSPAWWIGRNTNSGGGDSSNLLGYSGGGGGGYGSPAMERNFKTGRSGRGYGGGGFMGDLSTVYGDSPSIWMTPAYDFRWHSVVGASLGGAGNSVTNSAAGVCPGNFGNQDMNGKSGLCLVFYRIKE